MPRAKSSEPQHLLTVNKAIRVLRILAAHHGEMGVTDIARELDVYPSVASRLVTTLEGNELVSQNPSTRKYRLGIGLLQLASAVLDDLAVNEIAQPYLQELNAATGETIFLMILDRGESVYVQRIDSRQRVAIQTRIGNREPVHASAVGKALVAFLPEPEIDAIVAAHGLPARTSRTLTHIDLFKAHLGEIRRRGFAIDDEEGEPGIRCIGAPIFDHTGRPVAAVSISGPAFRTPVEKLLGWSDLLASCTRRISQELGYRPK